MAEAIVPAFPKRGLALTMRNGPLPRVSPSSRLLAMLLAALLAGVVAAACGDDGETATTPAEEAAAEDEIEKVLTDYGESEGAAACDFFSQSAIETLGGEEECDEQFETIGSEEFEVQEVRVDEDTATAQVRNVDSDIVLDFELVNEDGTWKISEFPGLGAE
jgi:hypothetical protein